MDKVWINSGCGQTLDISSIFDHLGQHPEFVQTLTSLKTLLRMELLVYVGPILDVCWTWPIAHGPPMANSVPNHSTPMAHIVPNHGTFMARSIHINGTLMALPWHTQGPTLAHSLPAKHVPIAHLSSLKTRQRMELLVICWTQSGRMLDMAHCPRLAHGTRSAQS